MEPTQEQINERADNLYNNRKSYWFYQRIARLELLSESKEQPGGSFEEWWKETGSDLYHTPTSGRDCMEAAFNAGKLNNK